MSRVPLFTAGLFAFASIAVASAPHAVAQTASQRATVTVPVRLSVTPPADMTITHDQSERPQAFPIQSWTVRGNSIGGVTVDFTADQPFTHQEEPDSKVHAELSVAIERTQGSANWFVGNASGTTRSTGDDLAARVRIGSDGIGEAQVRLSVEMVSAPLASIAQGNYATTIRCTVTVP